MATGKILIVDDDTNICELLRLYIEKEGYEASIANDGETALKMFDSVNPDLVLLDVMLPDEDGLSIVKKLRLRKDTVTTPIIMVTAKTTEIDKVKGLDIGADDYMTKPFGVMELISRVKAMLRRSAKPEEKEKILRLGNVVLDREKHAVFVNDVPCELTYKEYELLKLLMTNAGIVTTREVILDRIWGIDFEGESRTLDMHIKTLRQKLKEEGSLIKTVRNVGYIMNGDKV